jgi:hypothetical protein
VGKLTSIVVGKFVAFDSAPLIYYDDRWRRLTEIQVLILRDYLEPTP